MNKLCICGDNPHECPVVGHPGKTDRSAKELVLCILDHLGVRTSVGRDLTPIFFEDDETGRIYQIDAVVRKTNDGGDGIFLKGKLH